jgi:hypothetical protein
MGRKQRVLVEYFDDLTGDPLSEDQVQEVTFGWNNTTYALDLSKAGADKLEKLLKPYVESGRRVSSGRGRPKGSTTGSTRAPSGSGHSKETLAQIREWAVANGHTVSPRGRIAAPILEAWEESHKPTSAAPTG